MRVADIPRHVHWYLRELMGETQYDRYVERHRQCRSDHPLLSRREFEHQRTDRGDKNPGARCC